MTLKHMNLLTKRGQATAFIIIAIIFVAALILILIFTGVIKPEDKMPSFENPKTYIQACLEEKLQNNLDYIAKQGGSLNPQNYILYNGQRIEYLCYTRDYYVTCVMQKPLLKETMEKEINDALNIEVNNCFMELKNGLRNKGYVITGEKPLEYETKIVPKNVFLNISSKFTLTKGDSSKTYDDFKVEVQSEMYNLVSIALSILNWEARYGDAETTVYMTYYPNVKVEKMLLGDGTAIYTLSNRLTGDVFKFASRSIAWPAGYGADKISYF